MILLLSRGSAHRRAYLEQRLTTEGPDPLLDAPDLLEAPHGPDVLVLRNLVLLCRGAPCPPEGGVDDREGDYLAALLLDFGQRDRAWRIDGMTTTSIATWWTSWRTWRRVAASGASASWCISATTLWLAGLSRLYRGPTPRKAGPDVTYYDALGRRGFGMASDHALASEYGLVAVLRTAAERLLASRGA